MSKRVNHLLVKEIEDYLKGVNACVLIRCTGLTGESATKMRAAFRQKKVDLRVLKNSVSRIALREMGLGGIADLIDGPTAVASGGADPIVLAKAVAECAKEKDKERIEIRGGYCQGQVLTAAQIREFARIPSREVLLAQILAGIQAPLVGVAGIFASIQRSLVTALKAIADKKAQGQQA